MNLEAYAPGDLGIYVPCTEYWEEKTQHLRT